MTRGGEDEGLGVVGAHLFEGTIDDDKSRCKQWLAVANMSHAHSFPPRNCSPFPLER